MSYLQAIVIALVQGFTELFPVSSLGHSVLVPAWIGGSWQKLVEQSAAQNSGSSFYLAFIVALHVGTALALLWFFRADWIRILTGLLHSGRRSLANRAFSVEGPDERLAWLIVVATIPAGVTGLALEHTFRTLLAKPLAAAIFLFINGVILFAGERARQRALAAGARSPAGQPAPAVDAAERGAEQARIGGAHRGSRSLDELQVAYASDVRLSGISVRDAVYVGLLQCAALLAGISRSGITIVGGLWRGLDHEDAARFAFLLATPVILAAGLLKMPTLLGPAGEHIRGQAAVGFVLTTISAYISVRFLVRYFRTRTLKPFAYYCMAVGLASIVRFAAF